MMASNGSSRGSLRPHNASRSPSFVIIGLLVVIAIIGFNYWNVSTRNYELRTTVLDMTDRLRLAGVKRLSIEKRNDALAEQVKQARDDLENANKQIDSKNNELVSTKDQLDAKAKELTRIQEQELAVCHSTLASAKANTSQLQDYIIKLKDETSRLQTQLNDVSARMSNGELCKTEVERRRLELLQKVQQVLGQNSISMLQQNGVDMTGLAPSMDNRPQQPAGGQQGAQQPAGNVPSQAGAQVGQSSDSIVHVESSRPPSNSDPVRMKHGEQNMLHAQGSVGNKAVQSQGQGEVEKPGNGGVGLGEGINKRSPVIVPPGGMNIQNDKLPVRQNPADASNQVAAPKELPVGANQSIDSNNQSPRFGTNQNPNIRQVDEDKSQSQGPSKLRRIIFLKEKNSTKSDINRVDETAGKSSADTGREGGLKTEDKKTDDQNLKQPQINQVPPPVQPLRAQDDLHKPADQINKEPPQSGEAKISQDKPADQINKEPPQSGEVKISQDKPADQINKEPPQSGEAKISQDKPADQIHGPPQELQSKEGVIQASKERPNSPAQADGLLRDKADSQNAPLPDDRLKFQASEVQQQEKSINAAQKPENQPAAPAADKMNKPSEEGKNNPSDGEDDAAEDVEVNKHPEQNEANKVISRVNKSNDEIALS